MSSSNSLDNDFSKFIANNKDIFSVTDAEPSPLDNDFAKFIADNKVVFDDGGDEPAVSLDSIHSRSVPGTNEELAEEEKLREEARLTTKIFPDLDAPLTSTGIREQPISSSQEEHDKKKNLAAHMIQIATEDLPSTEENILNLARLTGADFETVKRNFGWFSRSVEIAKRDPEKWLAQNPELIQMLIEDPRSVGLLTRDKTVNKFLEELDAIDALQLVGALASPAILPGFIGSLPSFDKLFDEEKKGTETVVDKSGLSLSAATIDVLDATKDGLIMARMGSALLASDFYNGSSSDRSVGLSADIFSLQQAVGRPRYYGGLSAIEQSGLDLLGIVSNQAPNLVAIGAGTAVGAAASFVATPVVGVAIGAATIKALGVTDAAIAEVGSSYIDYREIKTDAGEKVSKNIAMAGALISGLLSAGVEFVSFGVQIKGFKDIVGAGGPRKVVSDMVRKGTSSGILKSLASHIAQSAATEGSEEGIQSMIALTGGWLTKVAEAGGFQETDIAGGLKKSGGAAVVGAIGGVFSIGAPRAIAHSAVGLHNIRKAKKNAAIIEAANKMSKGKMSRGAPGIVAKLIDAKAKASGDSVTSVFVDPVVFLAKLAEGGVDTKKSIEAVLGDNGSERIARAVEEYHDAPGGRTTLEIPMVEYLEAVGPTPLADALSGHTATENRGLSLTDVVGMEAQENQLAESIKNNPLVVEGALASEQEQQFSDLMKKVLVETHGIDEVEADGVVATARAKIRTIANAAEIDIPDMFDDWSSFYGKPQEGIDTFDEAAAIRQTLDDLGKRKSLKVSGIAQGRKAMEQLDSVPDISANADAKFRDFLDGKGAGRFGAKKPPPFVGGTFDAVNKELNLEGKKRVSGLLESFTKLMAHFEGPRHRKLEQTVNLLNEGVEGAGDITISQDILGQIEQADIAGLDTQREIEHFESLKEAAELNRPPDVDSFYQPVEARHVEGFDAITAQGIKDAVSHFVGDETTVEGMMNRSVVSYYDMLSRLKDHEGASDSLKKDHEKLREWLGAGGGTELTKAQGKKLSKGFQRYLIEGVAPSLEMVSPMASLKLFLIKTYSKVKKVIGVQINKSVRGVFDRMLATEADIALVNNASGFDVNLWRDLAESNMTKKEKEVYLEMKMTDMQVGSMKVHAEIHKAKLRATKAFRTKEFKKHELAAGFAWSKKKEVRALEALTIGTVKVSSGKEVRVNTVLDIEDFRKRFGKNTDVEKRLGGALKIRGDSVDSFAQSFQFDGADPSQQMFDAFSVLPTKEDFIQDTATASMRAQNPGIDGRISELSSMISEIFHGRDAEKWMSREYSAVGRRSPEGSNAAGVFASKVARVAARRTVSQAKAGTLSIEKAVRDERWTARNARGAIEKGKHGKARELLQQRLLTFHVWKETSRAVNLRGQMVEAIVELSDPNFRNKFITGDNAHGLLEAADQVIAAMGIESAGKSDISSIGNAINDIHRADGGAAFDVDDANELLTNKPEGGWENGTVEQMELFGKILKQIRTVIRRRGEHGGLVDQIAVEAASREDRTEFNKRVDRKAKISRSLNTMDADLTAVSQVFRQLGPTAFDNLWVGMIDAEATKSEMLLEIEGVFGKNWLKLPKAVEKTKFDLLTSQQLLGIDTDSYDERATRATPKDRVWMMTIALNMGSRSNRDKLLAGYNWNERNVLEFLDRNMTEQEWQFVQKSWDAMSGKFYRAMAKTREESTGTKPGQIEALAIPTRFGIMRGGFLPVVYDVNNSTTQARPLDAKSNGQAAATISVGAGFAQKRSESHGDAVLLEWGAVPSYVMNVAHYVAYDGFLRKARNIVLSDKFKNAVVTRVGEQAYENLADEKLGWLATLSGSNTDPVPAPVQGMQTAINIGKRMFGTIAVAYKALLAANATSEPLGFALASKDAPSVKFTLKAYSDWALQSGAIPFSEGKQFKRAVRLGREFRLRAANRKRGLRTDLDAVKRSSGKGIPGKLSRLHDEMLDSQGVFFDIFDSFSSTIVWNAAFMEAVSKGADEKSAARKADIVMSVVMPPVNDQRRAAALRDKRGIASWSALYGWFAHRRSLVSGRIDDMKQEINKTTSTVVKASEVATTMGSLFASAVMLDIFSELITLKLGEDEALDEFAARTLIASVFTYHPFGRVVSVGAGLGKFVVGQELDAWDFVNGNVVFSEAPLRTFKLINGVLDDEASDSERMLDAMEAAGIITSFPLGLGDFNKVNRKIFGDE